jgi:hypothetical protein
VLLGAVVAYAVVAGDRLQQVALGLGVAGITVALVSLAGRWATFYGLGLAIVGSAYAVYLSLRPGSVDEGAPLVATLLFLAAELGYWSLERHDARSEPAVLLRRLVLLAASACGCALVGTLLLVAISGTEGGVVLEGLGVAAAVLIVAVAAALTWRAGAQSSPSASAKRPQA